LQSPETPLDLPDFLRRLSATITGGNAEMLALAADEIEDLRRRAAKADAGESSAAAQARIAELTTEVETLRSQQQTIDETIAVVPVEQLRLARTQFDYLAKSFAANGDVISLTICQIGACAIDKALGINDRDTKPLPGAVMRAIS
jgi:hypothetical protein